MHRSIRRRSVAALVGLFAATTAAAGLASTAKADAPKFVTNFYYNCQGDHGIGVPLGDDLVVDEAWGAKTPGLALDFEHGMTPISAEIDGVPIADPEQYWTGPTYEGGQWVVRWEYDTGIVLTQLDVWHTIDIESVITHRITDGETLLADGTHKPLFAEPGDPGLTTSGPCLFAAF